MKRILDVLRATLISWEIVAGLIPFVGFSYWPEPAIFFSQQFSGDIKWAFAATVLPAGFMVASYQLGSEIISPHGARRIILDWPDYVMVKDRVVLALVFCAIGLVLGLAGAFIVARYKAAIGATLIFSGILSSAVSLASVALAKWKVREMFRE